MQEIIALSKHHRLLISSILAFASLIVFYYPTTTVSLDLFHYDDLMLMGRLNELNDIHATFNYIFSFYYYKFRPVANLQYVIEHFFFANNYNAYLLYNICLVLVLNYIFLLFIYEKTGLFVCLLISLVMVTSRFITYPIWNITGSFETLAAIIFLQIVFFVFSDIKASKKRLIFLALMLIFTSERYLPFLVALPIIYHYKNSLDDFIVSILKVGKYSIAILMAYVCFRYSMGIPIFIGTTDDNILESFSGARFFSHVLKAYSEIFGFSVGPKYLTGFEFIDWVPFSVLLTNTLYICGFFISLFLCVVSLYYFIFKCYVIQKSTLGLNLICLVLIMAASVTFRLELRWLLPSYLMLLLLFSYNRSYIKCIDGYFNIRLFDRTLFFTIIFLSIIYNVYYAIFFRRGLYFAEKQHDASIIQYLWSLVHE